jgi:hypothetical protein
VVTEGSGYNYADPDVEVLLSGRYDYNWISSWDSSVIFTTPGFYVSICSTTLLTFDHVSTNFTIDGGEVTFVLPFTTPVDKC